MKLMKRLSKKCRISLFLTEWARTIGGELTRLTPDGGKK